MFIQMALRDRLNCLADFLGINLLACVPYASSLPPMAPFLFLLPLPNCFLKVCFPLLFAAVLKFFLPLANSAIYGTANANKSAPTRFEAGTIFLRKNGIAALPKNCASAPNPRTRCRPTPLWNGTLLVLRQPSCNIFYVRNECSKLLGTLKQDEWYRQIQRVFVH